MKKSTIKNITVITIIAFSFFGCNSDDKQSVDQRNWQLSWSDEFNGNSGDLPDGTKWGFDLGTGVNGWGNQELQNYTNSPDNVSLDGNGNLVITAKRQNLGGSQYTSARIKTQNLFTQTYGRFEARLITPYGQGIWPAFWLIGANNQTVTWPQCGEIDIMELKGQQPSIIHGSLHGPGFSGANAITNTFALSNSRFDVDYHIFAVEWDAEKIDYFVDGYLYQRIAKSDLPGEWVYDHPFYMILNVAVGGNYLGNPNLQTPFPQKMTIDYVRVYKEAN
jgi:beta-glucanase (GH16 family)